MHAGKVSSCDWLCYNSFEQLLAHQHLLFSYPATCHVTDKKKKKTPSLNVNKYLSSESLTTSNVGHVSLLNSNT